MPQIFTNHCLTLHFRCIQGSTTPRPSHLARQTPKNEVTKSHQNPSGQTLPTNCPDISKECRKQLTAGKGKYFLMVQISDLSNFIQEFYTQTKLLLFYTLQRL